MDRLDALEIFVAVADQGSFIAAARQLNRAPTAVTRAVAQLEERLGTRLFNRTTRAVALTDAGTRYLDLSRRALSDFAALELSAASERTEPRGTITLTAPEMFGRLHVLPVVQNFMRDFPAVDISLLLLNRIVSYVDEGVDLGIRIARLSDSSLQAIQVGEVRRILCASPAYLAKRRRPVTPQDLLQHETIAVSGTRPVVDRWAFDSSARLAGKGNGNSRKPGREINVAIRPRLVVNSVLASLDAAVSGGGICRPISYQADELISAGKLVRLLEEYEPAPIPIQVVHPAGRYLAPKIRLFIDRAVAELRANFGG
jgi:DNA-binding transcriptional LysR family regulator